MRRCHSELDATTALENVWVVGIFVSFALDIQVAEHRSGGVRLALPDYIYAVVACITTVDCVRSTVTVGKTCELWNRR